MTFVSQIVRQAFTSLSVVCIIALARIITIEVAIYSQTDAFIDPRLQRSRHGTVSDDRATRHVGTGIVLDTPHYCSMWG